MKKYLLLLLCVLLISGFGCKKKVANVDQAVVIPEVNKEDLVKNVNFGYTTATISEETEKYYLDIDYPVFSGENQEVVDVINGNIKEKVDQNVQQFRNDYADTDHEYDPGPWFLGYDFYVKRNDEYFISVVLEGSIYTGGAHPNQMYETFVFNLEEGGAPMQLEDIFNTMASVFDPDSGVKIGWLDYLATHAQLNLMGREYADADWIISGAGPNSANFQRFYITNTDFVIIFPPYQVASYAEGPMEVAFGFDDLADYLRAYAF